MAFDPETIGSPLALYWASGAEQAAIGAADGTTPTWADEVGTADLTLPALAANRPLFRTAVAALNGKQAFEFVSTDRLFVGWTMTQPFDIGCVFKLNTVVQGTYYCILDGIAAGNRHAFLTNGAATPDNWWIYGGAGSVAGGIADTNAHVAFAHFEGASSYLEIDGKVVASGDAGAHSSAGLMLGAQYDATGIPMIGYIALAEAWDTPLTTSERQAFVDGAQTFYNIQVGPIPSRRALQAVQRSAVI